MWWCATLQPTRTEFNAEDSERVFRIMASDYAESTIGPAAIKKVEWDSAENTTSILWRQVTWVIRM